MKKIREALEREPPIDTMTMLGVTERESVTQATRKDYNDRIEQFKRTARLNNLSQRQDIVDTKLVMAFDQWLLAGCPFTTGEKLWAAVRFFAPAYAGHVRMYIPRSARALRG